MQKYFDIRKLNNFKSKGSRGGRAVERGTDVDGADNHERKHIAELCRFEVRVTRESLYDTKDICISFKFHD